MNSEGLSNLQATVVLLQGRLDEKCRQLDEKNNQIRDLKQDKDDLRADKGRAIVELTTLADELKTKDRDKERALADASRLSEELKAVRQEYDEFREAHGASTAQYFVPQPTLVSTSHIIEGEPTAEKRKHPDDAPMGPRKRGRPRKIQLVEPPERAADGSVVKRGRGRPRKFRDEVPTEDVPSTPKKRGRPPKIRDTVTVDIIMEGPSDPKGRGRLSRVPSLQSSPAAGTSAIKPQVHLQSLPPSFINSDEAFIFEETELLGILADAPDLVIEPAYDPTAASRQFLHLTYEGNPFQSVQFVKRNPSGTSQRLFIFPSHEVNPTLPFLPGQSGIVIDNRYFRANAVILQPWSLFRKVSLSGNGVHATWLYLGEYEFTSAGKMSAEVFASQTKAVKKNWATQLLSQKRSLNDIHLGMRARIGLRKAGILKAHAPISEEDLEELVEQEIEEMRAGRGHPVDTRDVVAAFTSGDEAIDITVLRCMSYDRILAEDIASKFAAYVSGGQKKDSKEPVATRGSTQGKTNANITPVPSANKNDKLEHTSMPSTRSAKMKALADVLSNPGPPRDPAGGEDDEDKDASDGDDEEANEYWDDEDEDEDGDLSYTSEDLEAVVEELAYKS